MKTFGFVAVAVSLLSLTPLPASAEEIVIARTHTEGQQVCKVSYRSPAEPGLSGMYSGQCVGGAPEGIGTVRFGNGDLIEGQFHQGFAHGSGVWKGVGGDSYRGAWRHGLRHGEGTYLWASGSRYIGVWEENKREGKGTYTWSNGDRFVGTFADNRHWRGTFHTTGGRIHRCIAGQCR